MFIDVSGHSIGATGREALGSRCGESSGACDSGEQQRRAWSLLQRRATSANMEHATMAGYTGARCAMKADFDCGILL